MKYNEIILKNNVDKILNNKNKILNKQDTYDVIKKFPNFKLQVYKINSKKPKIINNIMEIDTIMKEYSKYNFNFALFSKADIKNNIINIWITPIVESA